MDLSGILEQGSYFGSTQSCYCQGQGIHRLEAFVEEGNTASTRVLEKLGFVYEGKLNECEIKDGHYISLLVYALLA